MKEFDVLWDEKEEACIIYEEEGTMRLDVFLADYYEDYSRSFIQSCLKKKCIRVNKKFVKASFLLKQGDCIEVFMPTEVPLQVSAQDMPITLVYEDDHVAVVNKPQGMVVHPAPGHEKDTLVNGLLYHLSDLSGINGVLRPGIVHRIDKNTSGLLLVAKSNIAHQGLSAQLKAHTVKREYWALAEGIITQDRGLIDTFISRDGRDRKKMKASFTSGKHAITHYCVLHRFEKHTLVACRLETGRTHQIRVHMKHLGHPLVGDLKYGFTHQKLYDKGQLLHAKSIGFVHPVTGENMIFDSALPDYFKNILAKLGGYHGSQSCFDGFESDTAGDYSNRS